MSKLGNRGLASSEPGPPGGSPVQHRGGPPRGHAGARRGLARLLSPECRDQGGRSEGRMIPTDGIGAPDPIPVSGNVEMPVSVRKHSFHVSHCPAIQQRKLLLSP